MQKLPPISGAKGRSKSSMDYQYIKTKVIAQNQVFNKRAIEKMEVAPLYKEYKTDASITPDGEEERRQQPNPIVLYLQNVYAELGRILLKDESDPLFGDINKENESEVDNKLSREQLEKLFSDDIKLFAQNQENDTMSLKNCSVLGELGYNDDHINQLNSIQENKSPVPLQPTLSDQEVFFQAFEAAIQYLDQIPNNYDAVQALQQIKRYFHYKLETKSSSEKAHEEALKNLDEQIQGLEKQNSHYLQKIQEQSEIIERLQAYNKQINGNLLNSKKALHTYEAQLATAQADISQYKKSVTYLEQNVAKEKQNMQELQSRFRRQNEQAQRTKEQFEILNGKITALQTRLNAETADANALRQERGDLQALIRDQKAQLGSLEDTVGELRGQVEILTKQVQGHQEELAKARLEAKTAQPDSPTLAMAARALQATAASRQALRGLAGTGLTEEMLKALELVISTLESQVSFDRFREILGGNSNKNQNRATYAKAVQVDLLKAVDLTTWKGPIKDIKGPGNAQKKPKEDKTPEAEKEPQKGKDKAKDTEKQHNKEDKPEEPAGPSALDIIQRNDELPSIPADNNSDDESIFQGTAVLSTKNTNSESSEDNREIVPIDIKSIIPNSQNPSKSTARHNSRGQTADQEDEQSDSMPASPDANIKKPAQISMIPQKLIESGADSVTSQQSTKRKGHPKDKKQKDPPKSEDISKLFGKQSSRYVQACVTTEIKQTQYELITPNDKTIQTDIIFSPTSSRGPAFDYSSMIDQLRDEKIQLFNQLQAKQKELDEVNEKLKKLQVPKPKISIIDILKKPNLEKKKDQPKKLIRRHSFSDILNIPMFNGEQANMNFLDTQWLQEQNSIISSRSGSRALSRESKGIYNKSVQVDSYLKSQLDDQKAHQDEILALNNTMEEQLKQRDAVIQNLSKNLQQKINMLKVYKEAAEDGDISQKIDKLSTEMAEIQHQNELLTVQNTDLRAQILKLKHEAHEDRRELKRQESLKKENLAIKQELVNSSASHNQTPENEHKSEELIQKSEQIQTLTEEQVTALEKSGIDCEDCENKNQVIRDLQAQIYDLKQQLIMLQESKVSKSPQISTQLSQHVPTQGNIVNVFENALTKSKLELESEEKQENESSDESDDEEEENVLVRSQTRIQATMESLQRLEGKMPYNKENQDIYFQQLLEDVKTVFEQREQLKQQIKKQQLKFIGMVFQIVSEGQNVQKQIQEWNSYHETTMRMNNKNTQRSRTETYNQNMNVLNEQIKRVYDKLQKQQDKLRNTTVFDMSLQWQQNHIDADPELSQSYIRIQGLNYKRSDIRQIEQDIELMKKFKTEIQAQVDDTLKILDLKTQYQSAKLQQSGKNIGASQSPNIQEAPNKKEIPTGRSNLTSQLTSQDLETSFDGQESPSNIDQPKQPSILSTSPLSTGGYKIDRSQSLSPQPAKKRTQPNKNYQLLSKNVNSSISDRCKHLNEFSEAGVLFRVQGIQTELSLIGVTNPQNIVQAITSSEASIHSSTGSVHSVTVSGSFQSSGNYTIKSRQIDNIYKTKKEKEEQKKQDQLRKVLVQQKALILELQAKIEELSTKKVADKQVQVYIEANDQKDHKGESKIPSRAVSPRRLQSRRSKHERDMQLFNQLLSEVNDIQIGDIDDQLEAQEDSERAKLLERKLALYEQRINSIKASLILFQNKSAEIEATEAEKPLSVDTSRSVVISRKNEFRSVSEINKKYVSPSMVTLAQPAFQQFSIDKPIFNNSKAIERFREAQHQMAVKNVILQKKQHMLNVQMQETETRNAIETMVSMVQSQTQIYEKLTHIFDFVQHPRIRRQILAKHYQQGSFQHKLEVVVQETQKNISQDFIVSEFCLVGQEELIRSVIFGFVVHVDQEGNQKETYMPMMLKQLKDSNQYKDVLEKQKERLGTLLDTVLELATQNDAQTANVKTISDVNVNKRGQRHKDITTIVPITTGDIVYWVTLQSITENTKPQFIKLMEAFQGFPFKTINVSNQTYYNIKGQLHSVAWTCRVIRSIYRYIKDQSPSKILYLGNQTQQFFMTENQQKEDHIILDFQFIKGLPAGEPLFVSVINFAMSKYSPALAFVFVQTFVVNMLYFSNFNNEVRIFQYFLLCSENGYDLDLFQLYLTIRGFFNLDDVKNVQSMINKDILSTNIDEKTIDTKELVTATKLIFQNFTNERILTLVQIILSACGKDKLSLIKVIPLLLMSYQNYKKVTCQVIDKLFKNQEIRFSDFKHFVQNNALPISDDQIYEIFLAYACDNIQTTQYQISQFIDLAIQKENLKQLISDYQLSRFLVVSKSMISKSSTDQLLLDSYTQAYGSIKDGTNKVLSWLMQKLNKGEKAEKPHISQKQLNRVQNLMNAMKTDLQILDYRQFAYDSLETSVQLLKALFNSGRAFDACQVLHGLGQAFAIVEYGTFDEAAAARALSAMSKAAPSPNESQLSGIHDTDRQKETSENNKQDNSLKKEDLAINPVIQNENDKITGEEVTVEVQDATESKQQITEELQEVQTTAE